MTDTPTPDDSSSRGDGLPSHAEDPQSGGKSPGSPAPSRMAVYRYAVMGTELAGSALVFTGIGYAIDWARGHEKLYATAAGTLIGFAFAMYRFIIQIQRDRT